MDGFVEKVVEEQIFEIRVVSVGFCYIFQEDGTDDAAAAPHESDGWLIEFPFIFFGGLM